RNVKENNFPRISRVVVYSYPFAILNLANIYRHSGKETELKQLIELYKNHLKIGFDEEYEEYIEKELEK
ncbi:MAG: tetratricopeptide repeat-containing protein, partial [Bacteroidetes bacterium]|nr:tetratricopeptide repeat-containing protein [Bacteroidota bacterium]